MSPGAVTGGKSSRERDSSTYTCIHVVLDQVEAAKKTRGWRDRSRTTKGGWGRGSSAPLSNVFRVLTCQVRV